MQLGDGLVLAMEEEVSHPSGVMSGGALTVLLVLAVTVVALYAVHALLAKCNREAPLLEALNVLEHEQHVSLAVIKELQDKLELGITNVIASNDGADPAEITRLHAQLMQAQEEIVAMSARINELEQELEESTSSGLEMHAMLQDLLHSQKDTASFQEAIDNLQSMLDSQREKVGSLTADLTIKTTLNEELKNEAQTSREKINKLEYQLEQVSSGFMSVLLTTQALLVEKPCTFIVERNFTFIVYIVAITPTIFIEISLVSIHFLTLLMSLFERLTVSCLLMCILNFLRSCLVHWRR